MAPLAEAFVQIRPDTTGFQAEAERRIGTFTIPVRFRPDLTGFRAAANTALRTIRQPTVDVTLNPSVAGFAARATAAVRALRLKVPVRLVPDTAGFRTTFLTGIGRTMQIKVYPRLELTAFRAQYRIFERVYLRDRTFFVFPVLNPAGVSILATLMRGVGADSGGAFSRGFMDGMRAKLIAAAILVVLLALRPLLALIRELIVAAGALGAALPLAITTIIASVAALKLAFRNVGDAVKEAFKTDNAEQFNEAIKKLSPSARAFVLDLRKQRDELKAFQRGIQEQFFAPFLAGFRTLMASPALKVLGVQLGLIANYAGWTARNIALVVAEASRSGLLAQALAPARDIFGALASLLPTLTRTFLTLSAAAAPFVSALTGALRKGLMDFAALIDNVAADGTLARFFHEGLAALRSFGQLLFNIGAIFHAIFTGMNADSGSTLAVLSALTGQLAAFLRTAEGQGALASFGALLSAIGGVLSAVLKPLLPVAGALISALAGPLTTALTRLTPAISLVLTLLAQSLMPIIEALSPVISELAAVLTDFLIDALILVAQHMYEMAPAAAQVVRELGPNLIPLVRSLGDVLQALLPFIPMLSQAIIAATPAMVGLTTAVLHFYEGVAFAFRGIATVITWWRTTIAEPMFGFWGGAIQGAGAAAVWLWQHALVPAFNAIRAVLAGWWTFAQMMFGLWQQSLATIGAAVMFFWRNVMEPAWNAMKFLLQAWWVIIQVIFAAFKLTLGVLGAAVIFWWQNIVTPAFNAVRTLITGWWAIVAAVFNAVVGFVRTVFGPAFTWFHQSVIVPVFAGISGVISGVWNTGIKPTFTAIATFVTETLPKAFGRGAELMGAAFDRVRGFVVGTINWVIDNVINKVIGLWNFLAEKLGVADRIPTVGRVGEGGGGGGGGGGGVPRFRAAGGLVGDPEPVYRAAGGRAFPFATAALSRPGLLRGPGGPRADRIPLWASAEEFVVNARDTRWALPILEWINSRHGAKPPSGTKEQYRDGGLVQRRADGGLVGAFSGLLDVFTDPAKWIRDRVSGFLDRIPGGGLLRSIGAGFGRKVINAVVAFAKSKIGALGGGGLGPGMGPGGPGWQWMMAVLRGAFPGLPLISGFRPGSRVASGGLSYHAFGRAVDIPPRWDVFNWIISNFGRATRELIFSPGGARQIKNGLFHVFSGPVVAQHYDHIHWAMRLGGLVGRLLGRGGGAGILRSFDRGGEWPSGTLGINTSGRTETVTTGQGMDRIEELLERLIAAVERVAPGVGRELRGTSRDMLQIARAR